MIEFISCCIALFIVHGIPYILEQKQDERKERELENEMKKRENSNNWK